MVLNMKNYPNCSKLGGIMNLPNKLTIFRIILVPIMVIIPYLGISGEFFGISTALLIVDAIFIIASITDKLDGYLARKNNQITTFGKFLDPIADKILVLAAMIILVEIGKLPAWIPIIVIFREFIVSGYRLLASQKGGEVIAASFWGKLKTVTQMIAIIAMFLDKYAFFDFVKYGESMPTLNYMFNIFVSIMMLICVVATVFSGIDYLKDGKKFFTTK